MVMLSDETIRELFRLRDTVVRRNVISELDLFDHVYTKELNEAWRRARSVE